MRLGSDLILPDNYASLRGAIIAQSGGGKTYTASVLAEEMVKAGQPFYVLDPTDAWWGLRASATKGQEGLPVTVLGGEHGDVPIDSYSGADVAELVVNEPSFYVISTSHFDSHAEEVRFAQHFLDRLYRLKNKNKSALHGFWDEADMFAPQRVGPDQTKMVHAAEAIIRRGRIRNLGTTLITQRPAVLNKNVLTQINVLIALKITSPQDRKAIKEYLDGVADREQRDEVLNSLASLGRGEAWVYAPGEGVYTQGTVRARETFNSSATGGGGSQPDVRLADVDVDVLRERMKASIEKAEADDPERLRHQLAEQRQETRRLVAELDELRSREAPEPTRVVVTRTPDWILARTVDLQGLLRPLAEQAGYALRAATELREHIEEDLADEPPEAVEAPPQPRRVEREPRVEVAAVGAAAAVPPAPPVTKGGPKERILNALAMLENIGVTPVNKTQLGLFAQASPKSSAFANNLGSLRSSGLIDYPVKGTVALTDGGRAQADGAAAPGTVEELHGYVASLVGGAKWRILEPLVRTYPNALPKQNLAEAAGASATSSAFANNLGSLRSLGLIDYPMPGAVVALPVLFLER